MSNQDDLNLRALREKFLKTGESIQNSGSSGPSISAPEKQIYKTPSPRTEKTNSDRYESNISNNKKQALHEDHGVSSSKKNIFVKIIDSIFNVIKLILFIVVMVIIVVVMSEQNHS
jgi:hypothetical protein